MIMKRRSLILMIAAMLIICITGCGKGDKADAGEAAEATETAAVTEDRELKTVDAETEEAGPALSGVEKQKADIAGMQITYRFGDMQEVLGETRYPAGS